MQSISQEEKIQKINTIKPSQSFYVPPHRRFGSSNKQPTRQVKNNHIRNCNQQWEPYEHQVSHIPLKKCQNRRKKYFKVEKERLLNIIKGLEEEIEDLKNTNNQVKAILAGAKENSNPRIARWGIAVSGYDFEIRPKKGVTHQNADALSRNPIQKAIEEIGIENLQIRPELGRINVSQVLNHLGLKEEAVKNDHTSNNNFGLEEEATEEEDTIRYYEGLQNLDQDIQTIKNKLSSQDKEISKIYVLENLLIYRKTPIGNCLYVPERLKKQIMSEHHDGKFSGHYGNRKTLCKIKKKYFWPFMSRDIADYCRNCQICQQNKNRNLQIKANLVPMVADLPFERLGMDIIGPLPTSRKGNRYILIFVDYLTRYTEAFALKEIGAPTIAKYFVERIICRYGSPKVLHSDQGTNFTSSFMREVTTICKTKQTFSTPYHPEGNGLVERQNQNLIIRIRTLINKIEDNWDNMLPFALFCLNSTENQSTHFTPHELLYGRVIKTPYDIDLNQFNHPTIDPHNYLTNLKIYMSEIHKQAKQN